MEWDEEKGDGLDVIDVAEINGVSEFKTDQANQVK